MSDISMEPTRRPRWATRIAAGVVVVFAMLVPVAALVFLILHLFDALSFSHLS